MFSKKLRLPDLKEKIIHLAKQKQLLAEALQKTMLPVQPNMNEIQEAYAAAIQVLLENQTSNDFVESVRPGFPEMAEELQHTFNQQRAFLAEIRQEGSKARSGFSTDYRDFNWLVMQVKLRIKKELRLYHQMLKRLK